MQAKSKNLTFEQAASIPVGLGTAIGALFTQRGLGLQRKLQSQKEEWVFITGGASSVGVHAIQLAARAGYKVITTALRWNEEYVKSLGASHVIDYTLPASQQLQIIHEVTDNNLQYATDFIGEETSKLAVAAINPSFKPTVIGMAHTGTLELPEGVEYRAFSAGAPDLAKLIREVTEEDVSEGFASGVLKTNNVSVLEGGLEGLKEGEKLSAEGKVSALKLVVNVI
ncbi:hypothetical protein HDV00_010065 [Rhizophlyctis rosea]|nr:hypothetical protein HDV00_010065 [Rhizophlyctis rosea]